MSCQHVCVVSQDSWEHLGLNLILIGNDKLFSYRSTYQRESTAPSTPGCTTVRCTIPLSLSLSNEVVLPLWQIILYVVYIPTFITTDVTKVLFKHLIKLREIVLAIHIHAALTNLFCPLQDARMTYSSLSKMRCALFYPICYVKIAYSRYLDE